MKKLFIAFYLSVVTILGCNVNETNGNNHSPPSPVIRPATLEISKIEAYFDSGYKKIYVIGTVDNRSKSTISFLDHPEFVRLVLYDPDDKLLRDETDGISFINPAPKNVCFIPAGESRQVKAWVHLTAGKVPNGARAMLIVEPVSSTDLAPEIRLRLSRGEAVPLDVPVSSILVDLPTGRS